MNNLHMGIYAALAEINASLELRDMVTTENLDNDYRLAIVSSYKKMKNQLTLLTIISSVLMCVVAIISVLFTMDDWKDMLLSIFAIVFIGMMIIILSILYIMNNAGKIYTEARRAYRKGILGLSKEEAEIRLYTTEDEKQCLNYFKRMYVFDCILFLLSVPVAFVVGYYAYLVFESYFISVIILIVDVIYFMVFRMDSSKTEVHRLSTGYYRLPQKKICFECQKETSFLVHSRDTLFCQHCDTELKLESWEMSSYKMNKKIKWLINRRVSN